MSISLFLVVAAWGSRCGGHRRGATARWNAPSPEPAIRALPFSNWGNAKLHSLERQSTRSSDFIIHAGERGLYRCNEMPANANTINLALQ
ncbi:hypothetical protein [Embleya sp. NPDC001921]